MDLQEATGLETTPRVRAKDIAKTLNTTVFSIRKQVQRLSMAGLVTRVESRHGRGNAGSVFSVSPAVRTALAQKLGQETRTKSDNQTRTSERSSSGYSSLNGTTTADPGGGTRVSAQRAQAGRLEHLVHQFDLFHHGVGVSHLLDGWRAGEFESEQDFTDSVEHLAFYLSTDDAVGIKRPGAWVAAKLRTGYYPPPDGFVPLKERQKRAELEAKRERARRMKELQRESVAADFELWKAELSHGRRKELLKDLPSPSGGAAQAVLRAAFLEEHGYDHDALD